VSLEFSIVFKGRLLAGFSPEAVKANLTRFLKADSAQVTRMFSGKPVALKKGLDESMARHYLKQLRSLGLDAGLERMYPPRKVPPTPAGKPARKPANYTDFERTHINLARAEALLNGSVFTEERIPEAAPAPSLQIPLSSLLPAQNLPPAPSAINDMALTLNGRFTCSCCGAANVLQARLGN
jgi:hypothetical protein